MEFWDKYYQENAAEGMPWFHRDLDPDVEIALHEFGISEGHLLDLGTGPGTQAIELAHRGYQVTATDLSAAALAQAENRARDAGVQVLWKQDDILHTKLTGPFDAILDRGCMHVLPPEQRGQYVQTVARLLVPGGHLLLKTFSFEQPGDWGPYRFRPEALQALFDGVLSPQSMKNTLYQGTLDPAPAALFSVWRKRLDR